MPKTMIREDVRPAAEVPRVLIAANRLPLTASLQDGTVQVRRSDGGLVSGLREIARQWQVMWFGWHGLPAEAGAAIPPGRGPAMVAIPLAGSEVERFYHRFCNSVMWPALHGWEDEPLPDGSDWLAFRNVNQRYAQALASELQAGDRVWVHDFHLLLVPGMLRRCAPDAPIAFFLHVPFPDPAVFADLPHADELLAGMLGADVIGFHTEEYARHFVTTARRLGYATSGSVVLVDGRQVTVKVRAMGIDARSFSALANDARITADVQRLTAPGRVMLLGVDRLDYTKGIPQRLLAFECLLQKHPEYRGRITLVQIAVPSRQEIMAYRDLRDVVETLVSRINATFGSAGWTPIEYHFGTVDIHTLVALYCAADVMVITAQRDGLNLVAKEFVASRIDEDGVLVLSRFTGAASELPDALLVDPSRVDEVAGTFHRAITMPLAERRRRMRALRAAVSANSVLDWAAEFIDELEPASLAGPVL